MQRLTFILLLCIALILFNFIIPDRQVKRDLQSLEWMLGTWQRTNTKPGQTAYEKWQKISRNEFKGIGVTLKGKDTIFKEKLKMVVRDNELFYVAEVSHNPAPVYFRVIAQETTGFVSSNPNHDFPKEISYRIEGDDLSVEISGDGKSGTFNFVKVEF